MTTAPANFTGLEGHATATIGRADFDLTIPNVPKAANVDEKMLVEIEFVGIDSVESFDSVKSNGETQ